MIPLISHKTVTESDQIAEISTYQGAMSFHIYAMGFLEIAQVAARAALDNRTAIDAITPSIIYSIRHATELFLKHIIMEFNESHGVAAVKPDKNGVRLPAKIGVHGLMTLWRTHNETVVEALDYEADHDMHVNFDREAWLREFVWIIDQLHEIDSDGSTLRYPTDRYGTPNLDGKMAVSVAQLERFANQMAKCFFSFSERLS
jgi:hypothetical protein